MKEENAKDFMFVLYTVVILVLTIVYFTVPERVIFLSNTIDWWSRLLKIIW
jgi:hypothetical protein